jgi:hypothetical protein
VELVERYLTLGLRLGRHIDGLVDAYYGPAHLAEHVDAEPPADPAGLAGEAKSLVAVLDDGTVEDAQRSRWLRAQLVGLETVARRLAGETISYTDEVERCYGVRLARVPEERFEAAHGALDEVLPGHGDLAERYQAWAEALEVPRETLLPLVAAFNDDLRARTRELIDLPDGENTEIELVEDEPWSAFNYYLGDLRSRVVFNTDVPLHAHQLAPIVAHELYPGHHTEHAIKEERYVQARGELEHAVMLVGTPESMVSEGIAELALEILLGEECHAFGAAHAAELGVGFDPEVAGRVIDARRALQEVPINVALSLHEDDATRDEAIAYVRRWLLVDERRAAKTVGFVLDPTWRAYVACYSQGERLARDFVRGDRGRFRRLLEERLTPADLVPAASAR